MISTSKAVDCDHCKKWTHVKCTSSLTATEYDKCVNKNSDFSFICIECSIRCLLKNGDVHPQPISQKKPRQPKFPCTIYRKGVISTSKAVDCDHCKKWTHVKCTSSLTATKYDKCVNENSDFSFICIECSIRCLPFYLSDFPDDDQKKHLKKTTFAKS